MKRQFLKYEKVIEFLKDGGVIYTDRGFGNAPYTPLFYSIYKKGKEIGNIHHASIKKLVANNVIHGAGTPIAVRYKLKPTTE